VHNVGNSMNYYCYRLIDVEVVVIEIDSIYKPKLTVNDDSNDCKLGEIKFCVH